MERPRVLLALDFDGYGRGVLQAILRRHLGERRFDLRVAGWGETADDGGDLAQYAGAIGMFRTPATIARLRDARVAAVNCSMALAESGLPAVVSDHAAEAALAYEHLRLRGIMRFAFVAAGPMAYARGRGDAFRALAGDLPGYVELGFDAPPGGGEALRRILAAALPALPGPLGVFCANDHAARQVVLACAATPLRVGRDLAVVGVGDDELCCALTEPTLSSVAPDLDAVGAAALELLDEILAQGRHDGRTRRLVPPRGLVVRASSDGAACGDAVIGGLLAEVRRRPAAPWDLATLADRAGVSRRTLERRCRRTLGRGIAETVRGLRLEAAERLLRDGEQSVEAIARRCGFGSARRLREAYRLRYGRSPRSAT